MAASMVASMVAMTEAANAKVNLTLRVVGRRPDGYHEIESLVTFARAGDVLGLLPGGEIGLAVSGPRAADIGGAAGDLSGNLVLRAARALLAHHASLRTGQFILDKQLPVAAGLGGGSADAGAALRLLARANDLQFDDPRLFDAARVTGADVPVCLSSRACLMRGIGEVLSEPLSLVPLPCVLVNPGVAVATKDVFAKLNAGPVGSSPPSVAQMPVFGRLTRAELIDWLRGQANDLEAVAMALQPVVAQVLDALRALPGCRLARMSGSGATCFALFDDERAAKASAEILAQAQAGWWVRADILS